MDLKQRKLNKSEWNSTEVSVSPAELDILNLIIAGYNNVSIRVNHNLSLFSFLKIEYSEKMEDHLYNKYIRKRIQPIATSIKSLKPEYVHFKVDANIKPNSADRTRLERFNDADIENKNLYEFVLIHHIEKFMDSQTIKDKHFHYYTIYKLINNNILHLNRHIIYFVQQLLSLFFFYFKKSVIIENAVECIEKNESILKYGDLVLYEHQKEIFTVIKSPNPKLIMYMAPTGTGKTLTPIALSEQKKIIFVCAARHVGLALARAAVSVNKKIAFAFGCSSADDIRLHYFAAKEYTRNKRSGGIGKVDNSVGDNVQIIICDIKSYLPAMYYMLAFFKADDIATYWDEPTITMDYEKHEFHATIRKNWRENLIPTMVLSSATLPKESDLSETIPDFLNKFSGAEIFNIVSHDCKKSIPIIDKDGNVVLPHLLHENYDEMVKVATHCEKYLTLLRYFDLKETVDFISFVNKNNYANNKMNIDRHFEDIGAITMTNIKIYYVKMLLNIGTANWSLIYRNFVKTRCPRILENNTVDTKGNRILKMNSLGSGTKKTNSLLGTPLTRLASEQIVNETNCSLPKGTSGAYITTKDAYTLTDGPTIFITNDIEKVAKFCVQQANIPAITMDEIMKKIEYNNVINERIHTLETDLDAIKEGIEQRAKNSVSSFHDGHKVSGRNKSSKDAKKLSKDIPDEMQNKGALNKLTQEINNLRAMIRRASLNDTFIPNKKHHLEKWAPEMILSNAFTSNVDEQVVSDIMALNGVDNLWKILLMMGIGVFINHENISYTEIMKNLADSQKLYMIIASSDYIYGTNYQFCHGFLSKDLDLTQEKVIQAMGRIGRNNIQQNYSVRFRDNSHIAKLFTDDTEKPEVINMNLLFNSHFVKYENGLYVETVEEEDVITTLENTDTDTDTDTNDDYEEDA